MNDLPQGWAIAVLADLIVRDGVFADGDWVESKDQDPNGSIRLLQLADIGDGVFLDKSNRFINEQKFDQLQCTEVLEGDVLVARMPDPLGRACLAPRLRQRCITVVDVAIVRPGYQSVQPVWLMHFLNAPEVRQKIEVQSSGTTRRRISRSNLAQLQLPVAPFNEQKRIADKLDALLARVDACRERLDRVPAILKRFRQAVLTAATSGMLTEEWRKVNSESVDARGLAAQILTAHEAAGGHKAGNAAPPTDDVHDLSVDMFPQGWALLTLRDLVLPERPITYGILKPGPELEEGVPYVRVADFPNDRLNLSAIRKTSPKIDEEFKRSRLKGGDLLLSIRGTVGRLIVIPEELEGANITQDSARLSIQPLVNRDYVLWFLRSELAQTRMKGAVKGVAVRGINIGDVRACLKSIRQQAV
jgi:type I restriction enzyme, S subunit